MHTITLCTVGVSSSTAIGTVCGLYSRERRDRIGEQPGLELGVGPGPGDDPRAERRARPVAVRGLDRGDRGVDVLGIDVAVIVQVALEDLGALVGRQLGHDAGSSRSLSPRSAVRVWSAAGPNRSVPAKATVYTSSGSP